MDGNQGRDIYGRSAAMRVTSWKRRRTNYLCNSKDLEHDAKALRENIMLTFEYKWDSTLAIMYNVEGEGGGV